MIALQKPLLPKTETLMRYLAAIDESRWYTNRGPLVHLYEERLKEIFKCEVVATASGTAGLMASFMAFDAPHHDYITLPSWTFVATANAAALAGYELHFIDVDETTWSTYGTMLPKIANRYPGIGVSVFGAPVHYVESSHAFVIDAAAAFDAYASGLSKVGATPVVISTHATKTFSTGEGGLVLTTDKDLAHDIREIINHGLTLERAVPTVGFNGKLSEYHAAVGLASLDVWAETRERWLTTKRKYNDVFGVMAHTTPLASLDWVGSTFCVRLRHRYARNTMEDLQARGIMSRAVWGGGCHRYDAFRGCRREPLPVTEKLADEVLFLPFHIDMAESDIICIKIALDNVLQEPEREPNYWGV